MATALEEKQNELINLKGKMRSLHEERAKEEKPFSSEDDQKWSEWSEVHDTLTEEIRKLETAAKKATSAEERAKFLSERSGKSIDETMHGYEEWTESLREFALRGNSVSPEARSVLSGVRNHPEVLAGKFSRAQATDPDTAGGFLTHPIFSGELAKELQFIGGVREVARQFQTGTGADVLWPINDDSANTGEILGEGSTAAEQDMVFSQKILKAFKYSSKQILVSVELLADSQVDIAALILDTAAERIAKIQNAGFTSGAGTTEPDGVISSPSGAQLQNLGATSVIDYDDLLDVQHKCEPRYRPNGRWMMHDTIFKAVRGFKDLDGRPIWEPDLKAGTPGLLLGRPLSLNNDMDSDLGNAGARVVAFGDFSKYIVRDVINSTTIMRLNEIRATSGQVVFLMFHRSSGHPVGHTKSMGVGVAV